MHNKTREPLFLISKRDTLPWYRAWAIRLIAIAADAQVSADERGAFDEIVEKLTRLETAIRAMRIWIEHDAARS